jgi:uncharacterized Fe-S radical SAM superfamily protein PflX
VYDILEKCEVCEIKKTYNRTNNKKRAPNWVQKNIKYAASTHLLVLANLYKIKKEGTRRNS